MPKKSIKISKREKGFLFIIVVLIAALLSSICFGGDIIGLNNDINEPSEQTTANENENNKTNFSFLSGDSNITLPDEFDLENILEVHFIDIGQGDAIVVRLPDGKDMLIDAGSGTSASNATKQKYLSYLAQLNIDTIDFLMVTHPDSDHVNMMNEVLKEYQVENIYYNDTYEGRSNTYKNFIDEAQLEGAENLYNVDEDGETYTINSEEYNYEIEIYAPGYDRFEDANSMSMITILRYGGRKILFTGDAHYETENWLMNKMETENYDIDILKIGHHGSNSSSSDEFLEFFDPEYGVISVGEDNSYGHPAAATMNRLFNYGVVTYRTNRQGNIVLYIDNDGDFGFLPENNVPVENNSKDLFSKTLVNNE